jgi:hypothetical protein
VAVVVIVAVIVVVAVLEKRKRVDPKTYILLWSSSQSRMECVGNFHDLVRISIISLGTQMLQVVKFLGVSVGNRCRQKSATQVDGRLSRTRIRTRYIVWIGYLLAFNVFVLSTYL